MAMSLSGASVSAGADSGVETGNESNDIDSSTNTTFCCFDGIENDGNTLNIPPPPPTSPESSHSNQNHDIDSESEMTVLNLDELHNCYEEESCDNTETINDVCLSEMDGDVDIDEFEQEGSRRVGNNEASDNRIMNQSCKSFILQPFVTPMVSPPAPPATPTNTCKALIKFEFPELLKLTYQFVDPPAIHTFLSVEEFAVNHTEGYSIVKPVPDNFSNKATPCTALIPYEQREIQRKSNSRNPWRKVVGKKVRNHSFMSGRLEYNERRLRTAANSKNIPILSKLLQTGIDPNAADELGRTSLHIAACKGFSEVVRLLLQYGANPNLKDSVGNTPLHLAACTNHFDVVTCLLRAGTDVSTLDNNGRNPLQLAQSKLKLIACSNQQPASEDTIKIKMEIQQIIEMMLEYLQKKGQGVGTELLNAFANRLTLSQTADEVDADVKNLLANLSSLTLNSPLSPSQASQNSSLSSTGISTHSSFASEIPSNCSRPCSPPFQMSVLGANSRAILTPHYARQIE